MSQSEDRVAFGRQVLGPVFAEFAMRLWMLLSNIESPNDTTLLFCARGGLRLKLIYDRFLAAGGLTSPVRSCELMVSRVVALRVALAEGCPSAYEQIGYEMGNAPLRDIIKAVSGVTGLDEGRGAGTWDQIYSREQFVSLLNSDECSEVRANIQAQAQLFREHLESLLAGGRRPIICDTGLSGSTMQLLEDGLPDLTWGCALFARSNYKKLPTPHYKRTVGVSIEADGYSPLDRRTSILRYWHLIESILEPNLPSVTWLSRVDGTVRSNLESPGWQSRIEPAPGEFFRGVLDYIDLLPRGSAAAQVLEDVDKAYSELRQAVIWPDRGDVDALNIGSRSKDFGRIDDKTGPVCERGIRGALRRSLWREGAVVGPSASFRGLVLAGIEGAHIARWALKSIRSR